MKQTLVQYKIRADKVEENEQLVRAVYQQLDEEGLEGFRYMTLKLQDGQTFMHIALAASEETNAVFTSLPAFQEFRANIKARCEQLPVAGSVLLIGVFGEPFKAAAPLG